MDVPIETTTILNHFVKNQKPDPSLSLCRGSFLYGYLLLGASWCPLDELGWGLM
jgi:hypothetical protein